MPGAYEQPDSPFRVPDGMREFQDTAKTRKLVYDGVLDAVSKRFPVEDDEWRLELVDVGYDGPQDFSLKRQKDALLKARSLRTPIKGTWRLVHKPSGKVIDQRTDTVMQVPYYTDRGTVINSGSEYTVISQSRLRPGVYARRTRNGEIETQFNVKWGTGHSFKVNMDPSSGVFTLTAGQAHIPLYPILKGMGVDDKALTKAWGADIVAENAKKGDPTALRRAYERVAGRAADAAASDLTRGAYIRDALGKYTMDADIVERNTGLRNVSTVTPELLLRATQRMLNINRGEEQPDNRDNPRYSAIYSIEDLLRERVDRDSGKLAQSLFRRAKRDRSLRGVRRNVLTSYMDAFLLGSGLAMPGEETNPLFIYEQLGRVTKMGEGGIKSSDAITDEARAVNGDYLGFVDPIQGPECVIGTDEVMTSRGWVPAAAITAEDELACVEFGRVVYRRPSKVHSSWWEGAMCSLSDSTVSYLVTPNHRVWHREDDDYYFAEAKDLVGLPVTLLLGGVAVEDREGSNARRLCASEAAIVASKAFVDGEFPEWVFSLDKFSREMVMDEMPLKYAYRDCGWKVQTRQMACSISRLLFTLGLSSRVRKVKSKWVCDTLGEGVSEHTVPASGHSEENYSGMVYCVTVPGGRFYVRHGGSYAHWTGNSEKIGIDVRTTWHTFKGADNKLYGEFINARTGKREAVDVGTASDRVVAFPGQDMKAPYVYAMRDNVPTMVPSKDVDYVVPSFARMMSSNTNMNPMPTAVQAGRQFYGSKFWSQYLPQKKGEVPLVDSLMPDGKETFSEYYGRRAGCLRAPAAGTVIKVTDDEVTIKDDKGGKHVVELVRDLPYNRLSGISYYPSVKPGDRVDEGGMVAHSNYTDEKTGAFNMGQNLKVAVAAYKGHSFEDAHVISESAAKKLATDRLYGFDLEERNGVALGRSKYLSLFPNRFTKDQAATLDDNGVVKVGTVLHRGDPLFAAVGPKVLTSADAALGKLSKVLRNSVVDKSQTWEHDYEGTVVDATPTPYGARVDVKASPPVRVADKLSGRFGLKGVVGNIVKDDEMPRDAATNEPYDMLINPMGFLSRVAPGQLMEMALGKYAKATGSQVRLPQLPPPEGWAAWTTAKLKEAGVPETADIFDPATGKTIKNMGDGYVYISAFHHLAEKKASSRGADSSYTQDEQPSRGGEEGGKRISMLDTYALLAHGATGVVRDSSIVRGTRNEQYWNALRLGLPIPEPGVPFIYEKFLNTLRAGGINVVEKGNLTSIMPMTDKDIDRLAGTREITSSAMLDPDFEPVKGGLFDLGKTGGTAGSQWSAIPLPEPVPNPIMEEPVRRVLGLTAKRLEAILSGTEELDGKTGGAAIRDALAKVDVDRRIAQCHDDIRNRRGSTRDNAIKVLGYLQSMKRQGLSPTEWMISRVPVLPPKFRPVSRMGDVALVSDLNDLYKDVIENANTFRELRKDLPDSAVSEERLNLYKSVKAAFGLGEAITPEGQAKHLKGAIRQVIGTSPKFGLAQRKVFSKTVDTVGRAAITPDPNLDMDQVGIPEEAAWKMYKPYVMRALVQSGYPPVAAIRQLEERTETARNLLNKEMAKRPILMDRAPTWHKFNILAFMPHVSDGTTVRVSPLVVSGFNADFNGDSILNPLVFACINGQFVVDYMSEIVRKYFMPDYSEESALELLGRQTTFLQLKENAMQILGFKDDGTTGFVDVQDISIHTSHGPDCYHVKTRDGLDAVFTAHHNFWTVDDTCTLVPCKTTAVGVGSLVPFAAEFDIPVRNDDPEAPRAIRRTFETGLWFGHYFGDGSITGRSDTVSQAGTDALLLDLLEAIGNDITGVDAWREGNGHSVRWTSRMWAKWFESLGLGADGKKIPGWMFRSGKEFLKGLLCGFILAEGHYCASGGCCRIETVNRKLLVQFKYISQSLGCVCRLRDGKPSRTSSVTGSELLPTWYIDINMTTLSSIGLQWPDCAKSRQFSEARIPVRKNWDLVPFPKCVQDLCASQGKFLQTVRGERRLQYVSDPTVKAESKQYAIALHNSYCTRDFARRIAVAYGLDKLEGNDIASRWISLVNNSTVRWDVIEVYEKAPRPVVTYDMCVPGLQGFAVDGAYLTHNTVNYHVPSSDRAVKDALEKMLPSKNLVSLTDMQSARHPVSKEQILGLYALTQPAADKAPVRFGSVEEARRAYREGRIGMNDPIVIG